jgi:hypothetical protein
VAARPKGVKDRTAARRDLSSRPVARAFPLKECRTPAETEIGGSGKSALPCYVPTGAFSRHALYSGAGTFSQPQADAARHCARRCAPRLRH